MTDKQALKLAILALKKQMQPLAPEANMFLMGIADGPYHRRAAEQYKELAEAISQLEKLLRAKSVQPGLF